MNQELGIKKCEEKQHNKVEYDNTQTTELELNLSKMNQNDQD